MTRCSRSGAITRSSPTARTGRPGRHHHRRHAIIETVFADLIDGPLAHLPSGRFAANTAWLICAAIAHNLLRATGVIAGTRHAVARGATLRPPSSPSRPPGPPATPNRPAPTPSLALGTSLACLVAQHHRQQQHHPPPQRCTCLTTAEGPT